MVAIIQNSNNNAVPTFLLRKDEADTRTTGAVVEAVRTLVGAAVVTAVAEARTMAVVVAAAPRKIAAEAVAFPPTRAGTRPVAAEEEEDAVPTAAVEPAPMNAAFMEK